MPQTKFRKIVVQKSAPNGAATRSWSALKGEFFDMDSVDIVCKDHNYHVVYVDEATGQEKTVLRLCKNVLSRRCVDDAWAGLIQMAKTQKTSLRGAAAGKLDMDNVLKYAPSFRVTRKTAFKAFGTTRDGKPSSFGLSNTVHSNIIGYKDLRPALRSETERCRLTAFSAKEPELYGKAIPLLEEIDAVFAKHEPQRHQTQLERARKSDARIADTAFSTTTVNYGFRTALHQDTGDFEQGFGILVVMHKPNEPPNGSGGELLLPEFRIAVALESRDVLLFDTHQYHCNAPLAPDVERLSLVCYLREKIATLCPHKRSATSLETEHDGGTKKTRNKA